ncbi:hypothetical protein GCM10009799_23260 [Nocardiopsis rhodophaea]|uniref:TrbL/VirB6 plasmid conjugal transfer protein n=1 Tax=Nocardiopsis rhodophaea TaxID=280238 RepID=A0ABN2T288_9ACTN
MCDFTDIACHFREGAKTFAETAFDKILSFFSDAIVEAIGDVVESLGTMWVGVDVPNLTTSGSGAPEISRGATPDGANHAIELMQYATWIAIGVCVLSLIVLGARLALARSRGEGAGHLGKIGVVLFGTTLISAASAIVLALMKSTGGTGATGPAAYLQNSLWWYMGAAAVMSVIIGAAKMAWEQRAEPGRDLLKSLFTLVVVSGAGLTAVNLAVMASDSFSKWVLENATSKSFDENMTVMLSALMATNATLPIVPIIVIILGLFALFASFIQMLLMVVRIGMLVILAGVLPLAASFTNTEMGKSWFKKCLGWLVAFILYKPAAAIIYAAAFQLVGSDIFAAGDTEATTELIKVVAGITLMVVALIAMPALMKFVTPMVGAMAAGAAAGGAAAGAAMEMPTGALRTLNQGGGGDGGGGGGSKGSPSPSGAANTGSPMQGGASMQGGGAIQGGGAMQGGGQMAGAGAKAGAGAGAKAGAGAAAGAATAGVATAALAAAETAKKAGEAVANTVKETAESSAEGGEGPSGSR